MDWALEAVLARSSNSGSSGVLINPALINVLFGSDASGSPCPPTFRDGPLAIEFCNPGLNDIQQQAVEKCLQANHVALIHGPPGNKYFFLNEPAKQKLLLSWFANLLKPVIKFFSAGPSNISVDTLGDRLVPYLNPKLQITRIGHPSRIRREGVLSHVLDIRVRTSDEGQIANDVRNEMDATLGKIQKCKGKSERRAYYDDMKRLRAELRIREKKVVHDIIHSSDVVLSTLSGCGSYVLQNHYFDAIIIDESSQAMEPEPIQTLFYLNHWNKHCFDRLLSLHGPSIKTMLTTQYRMNTLIMQHPSSHMTTFSPDLPDVKETDHTTSPLTFINTCLCDYFEASSKDTSSSSHESYQNQGEATLIEKHVHHLIDAGVPLDLHQRQVQLLQSILHDQFPALEIGTVDSFQGAEKEAILLSLVRSNATGELGFLEDERRLNVAMTRARRHLCVVGDERMVKGKGSFLEGFVKVVEEFGDMVYAD
ncbi:AAA domain-containing protein [Obelidium mucronatum]|nr:AAA domain-containing protein [Obelidium mucronatum]